MTLTLGTRLGPYEVLASIGAGGMGEVYRARDTRLHRDVAVKVLPGVFAADPDRMMRFEREAQALAALNHPHIAAIYGLEEKDGVRALVMELVEGDTLAERLRTTALPWRESVRVAIQIADALEAAHEKTIIHRDLKPANIKITPDGSVKVLDFGLAKALEPAGGRAELSQAPTLSVAATQAGVRLGTAAYMSPEQARGIAADARADIWAFGCVLFEMLGGRPAFEGGTVSDIIAGILRAEPAWSALPADLPPTLARVLRRCLAKERKQRYQAIGDVRADLEESLDEPAPATATAPPDVGAWRTFAVATMAAALGAAITAAVLVLWRPTTASPAGVVRFAVHDTDRVIVSRAEGAMALSPDGRTLAFVGFGEGGPRIWIRALDALEARSLPGTEGAGSLCWSPDGRSLAFVASARIKKVAVAGGTPDVFSFSAGRTRGGWSIAWGSDGTILYGNLRGFWRVAANGGAPANFFAGSPDEAPDSLGFLPDGRHFLFSVRSADPAKAGTFVAALDGGPRTRLLGFPTPARYATGRLLFVRDRVLYAQAFDLSKLQLSGDPVPLAENVAATFSVSDNGVAAYLPVTASEQPDSGQLLWMDRGGQVLDRIDRAAGATRPTLSPDGRRLAMTRRGDLWVLELARGVLSRLTVDLGTGGSPTWSADGQRLMFHRVAVRNRKDVIFETPVGSAGKETIVREPDHDGEHAHPTDASADGQYLVYEGGDADDIWVTQLTGDRKASAYVQTPSIETQGALSPDGHWLSYTSDISGRFEVYVQSFPEPGARMQVSTNGGSAARWRRDGKELFYLAPDGTLMAVPARSAAPVEFGSPASLFRFFTTPQRGPTGPPYDVTPDGQRFIVSAVVRRTDPSLYVLLNWPALAGR